MKNAVQRHDRQLLEEEVQHVPIFHARPNQSLDNGARGEEEVERMHMVVRQAGKAGVLLDRIRFTEEVIGRERKRFTRPCHGQAADLLARRVRDPPLAVAHQAQDGRDGRGAREAGRL